MEFFYFCLRVEFQEYHFGWRRQIERGATDGAEARYSLKQIQKGAGWLRPCCELLDAALSVNYISKRRCT